MRPTHSTTARSSRVRNLLVGTALGGALAIGGVGIAGAAIPSSDGTVTACKNAKGGLKVINAEAGKKCAKGQKKLTLQSGREALLSAHWVSEDSSNTTATSKSVSVDCPDGETAIGGGAQPLRNNLVTGGLVTANAQLRSSTGTFDSWTATADYTGSSPSSWLLRVKVLCVTLPTTR